MFDYQTIELSHANLKKPLTLIIGRIAGFHYSDTNKCTHVYTTAGVFPALETEEQIKELLNKSINDYNAKTKP